MLASLFSAGAVLLLLSLIDKVMADSVGCGKTPTLTSGTKTMTVAGKQRQYILRIPDKYDNSKPHRIVFGFHWYGGTMTDVATGQTVQRNVWDYYGLRRLANESTIFVAPQGLDNGWGNTNGNDVTFVDQMIQTIESDLCVNEKLRFATGFSYGNICTSKVETLAYIDFEKVVSWRISSHVFALRRFELFPFCPAAVHPE